MIRDHVVLFRGKKPEMDLYIYLRGFSHGFIMELD
jgi:hypothetical protein